MRRAMIAGIIPVSLLLSVVTAASALAFEEKKFDASSFNAAQAAGGPVVVHVTAPWCPTCTAQHAAIRELSKKPELASVTIFDVDFDTQADVMKSFKARQQSTLIAFKGATETGRIAGESKAAAIEALFQSALAKK